MAEMTNRPVRIGVVGSGIGADLHIPGFQSEGLEVVAVCTQHLKRAEKTAEEFGILNAYSDYRAMLGMPGLDAVSIASPPVYHHEMVMAALDAGKHVLCEKPFAMDQDQARSMLDKSRATGLTAMANTELRFIPARAYVKELMEQGYIGDLRNVTISAFIGPTAVQNPRPLHWRDQACMGGGLLRDHCSHYVDCLRDWFGEIAGAFGRTFIHDPERVAAAGSGPARADADDAFSFLLTFAKGGWACLSASSAAPFGSSARIDIYGSQGTLQTPQPAFRTLPDVKVFGARFGDGQGVREMPIPERFRPLVDDRDRRLVAFRILVRRFLRGIAEGTSPTPNFYDAYRCQQVVDAIRQSNATGRWVDIPNEF